MRIFWVWVASLGLASFASWYVYLHVADVDDPIMLSLPIIVTFLVTMVAVHWVARWKS